MSWHCHRAKACIGASAFAFLVTVCVSGAASQSKLERPVHIEGPRDVFFSDFHLFGAQQEIYNLSQAGKSSLKTALQDCQAAFAGEVAEQFRCQAAIHLYLLDHQASGRLARVLSAVGFSMASAGRSKAIGRVSEPGLAARFSTISKGLSDALTVSAVSPVVSAVLDTAP